MLPKEGSSNLASCQRAAQACRHHARPHLALAQPLSYSCAVGLVFAGLCRASWYTVCESACEFVGLWCGITSDFVGLWCGRTMGLKRAPGNGPKQTLNTYTHAQAPTPPVSRGSARPLSPPLPLPPSLSLSLLLRPSVPPSLRPTPFPSLPPSPLHPSSPSHAREHTHTHTSAHSRTSEDRRSLLKSVYCTVLRATLVLALAYLCPCARVCTCVHELVF